MNYILMPSLEHIALIKVAIVLWNQKDIRAHFTQTNLVTESGVPILGKRRREEWQKIEKKVIKNLSQLPQPKLLKDKILKFIQPIGLQILKWLEYHNENSYFGADLPNEMHWTPQGAIDKEKTAEVCVKNQKLDVVRRYNLACNYCLENDIAELWSKIPENKKKSFYNEYNTGDVSNSYLVVFCSYKMQGEIATLSDRIERRFGRRCSLYQYAFECAADSGNKVAVKYFLQKLTPKEREESLIKAACVVAESRFYYHGKHTYFHKEHYIDVLCFLLSQMDEEQQTKVFKKKPFKVLGCFLDWPWQNFFLETANCMWNFLPEKDFYSVLRTITHKVRDGFQDCNYQKLFGEFWDQSPITHKKYCIGVFMLDSVLLLELFKVKDKENVRLILKHATIEEKEKIILKRPGWDVCKYLIYDSKWDLLKFFAQECIPSEDVMMKFKAKFIEHIMSHHCESKLEEEQYICNKFFQLLDDLIRYYKKKNNEN